MSILDILRPRRGRPAAVPGPTHRRHDLVVPTLPERDDFGGGWPPGYLDAHAEADRISLTRVTAARVREAQGDRELLNEMHLREQDEARREQARLHTAAHLVRARASYDAAVAEAARTAPAQVAGPEPGDDDSTTSEVPAVEVPTPDYSRIPAHALKKDQARLEARRLTDLGVEVPQNNRDLGALREAIRKAREALGEKEESAV